jgi:hypothetical protein
VKRTGKQVAFSPGFAGESPWQSWKGIESHGFLVVKGVLPLGELVVRAHDEALELLGRYAMTEAKPVELCR